MFKNASAFLPRRARSFGAARHCERKEMEYKTKGTCSTKIDFELDGDIIRSVRFTGGCNGNLQAISRLVDGMPAQEAIRKLEGIRCGFKSTSCPDQLAKALKASMEGKL